MVTINGHTRTCGLLGNPVGHTMSPAIHNYLARETGDNLVYVPFPVQEGRLEEALQGADALDLLGLNVTVPYKSEVIPYLKEIDPQAQQIGAVNTLVRCGGGYKGYNTDMPGLYRAMCADGVKVEEERVLILGAGGVARAVAMLMARKNAGEVVILNRTAERGEAVAAEINGIVGHRLVRAMALSDYGKLPGGERYLAVQATSVGMHPHTEAAVIEDASFYERVHTGYDLIFNPLETKFMRLVKQGGGRAFNGAKMLLYQGIIAYEYWTGRKIPEEMAQRAYEEMLGAMGR